MADSRYPHPLGDWLKTYKAQRKVLPAVIGNEAVNFFRDNFRRQGFLGDTLEKWKKRKNNRDKGRHVLIKSGALRNSIRIKTATYDLVIVATRQPYAAAHNEGFKGTVTVKAHNRKVSKKQKVGYSSLKTKKKTTRSMKVQTGSTQVKQHSRKMDIPKRQFMGDSQWLDNKIDRHITNMFLKTFNK